MILDKIRKLLLGEQMRYIFFGVMTTLVNFIVYFPLIRLLGSDTYLFSTSVAWVAAVTFAYITNKLFVFESKSWAGSVLRKEIPSFLAARVASLGIEALGLYLFNDLMGFNGWQAAIFGFGVHGGDISKIIMQFVVIVMNYVFSKLVIFKKDGKG